MKFEQLVANTKLLTIARGDIEQRYSAAWFWD
jgi:hypothetical protein